AVIRRCRARTTRKSLPLSHSPRLAPHHALPRPRTLSPAYCAALAHTRTIVSTRSSLLAPAIARAAPPPAPPPAPYHSTPPPPPRAPSLLLGHHLQRQTPLAPRAPPRPHAHHSTPHAHHPHQKHKKTSARVRRMPLYYVTSM